jgi:hypothetical protein
MSDFYDSRKAQAYAELDIWGNTINPDEITRILGISPTSSNEVGDIWKLNGKPFFTASWTFETEKKILIENASERLDDLINVFKEKTDELSEIKKIYTDCTIIINIVVYNNQNILPGISIKPEQISFLANIGAGIDFDIYHNQ